MPFVFRSGRNGSGRRWCTPAAATAAARVSLNAAIKHFLNEGLWACLLPLHAWHEYTDILMSSGSLTWERVSHQVLTPAARTSHTDVFYTLYYFNVRRKKLVCLFIAAGFLLLTRASVTWAARWSARSSTVCRDQTWCLKVLEQRDIQRKTPQCYWSWNISEDWSALINNHPHVWSVKCQRINSS